MPQLDVPGAKLHYEVSGKGPLLLCVSGANGAVEIWKLFIRELQDSFTIASYDRRGFSRSTLTGAQDYENRLARDADDAAALIHHLSPNEPAIVLGNSSGAIVSLELMLRHHYLVKLLIPHEPPLMRLCPNWPDLKASTEAVYATYRRAGPYPALGQFCELVREEKGLWINSLDPRNGPYVFSNIQYWFEREFLVYPFEDFSSQMFLQHREKIMFAVANLSQKDALQYQANERLSRELGLELVHLPGGHVGFATHFDEFAPALLEAIKKRGLV